MYQAFLDTNVVTNNSYIWKIKVPLKIKVFLWLLHRQAILTKDNLVKKNWHINVMCYFSNSYETIQHLFFECALTKFIWRVIEITFGLAIPLNIKHVFSELVQRMNEKDKKLLYVRMDAIFWSIWLSRNDLIFNKTPISFYMQVMFRVTYWTRIWVAFQKEESQRFLRMACQLMEVMTMDIFIKHG
jgi:hypothetical protein